MLDLTVSIENGVEIVGRLQLLGEAAAAYGGSRVNVGSALNYARYVVDGTRPHMIYPSAKRALYWPGAAHPVRSVNHPGTKPNSFMSDALEAVAPQAEAALTNAAETVLAGGGDASTLTRALSTAGLLVQAEMMRRSPVKTGGLRASLHSEVVS